MSTSEKLAVTTMNVAIIPYYELGTFDTNRFMLSLPYPIRLIDSVFKRQLSKNDTDFTPVVVPNTVLLWDAIAYELTLFKFRLTCAEFKFLHYCCSNVVNFSLGKDFWEQAASGSVPAEVEKLFRTAAHNYLTTNPDRNLPSQLNTVLQMEIRPRPKTTEVVAIGRHYDFDGTWSVFLKMEDDPYVPPSDDTNTKDATDRKRIDVTCDPKFSGNVNKHLRTVQREAMRKSGGEESKKEVHNHQWTVTLPGTIKHGEKSKVAKPVEIPTQKKASKVQVNVSIPKAQAEKIKTKNPKTVRKEAAKKVKPAGR